MISFSNQEKHQGVDGITGIEYNHDQKFVEYEVENAKKIQRFRLDLEQGKNILYYMKVEVTVVGDFPTPLLCFSSSDSNCNENREQIVKNPKNRTGVRIRQNNGFLEEYGEESASRDAARRVSTVPRTGIPVSYLCRIIQSPTVAPDTYQGFKHERLLFLCCPK